MKHFTREPEPPYFCVVFTSLRTDSETEQYDAAAQRMFELASQQPGFLGVESCRDANGFGITVSYWDSEDAIQRWRENTEHLVAQEQGRVKWYSQFKLRIGQVIRHGGWKHSTDDG